MTDEESFKNFLVEELCKRSGNWLPFPPKSSHDHVQYLAWASKYLCPEYVFKWPQLEWFNDPAIQDFYKDFPQEKNGFNMDRRWNVLQFLRLIAHIPGDTIECGVFEGATSLLILKNAPNWQGQKRTHHIFDSFEGCSVPGEFDHRTHFYKGVLSCGEEQVRKKLQKYNDRTCYYKGWIPSRFADAEDKSFAFAHIDVDLYDPTLESIKFVYPRLAEGAVLICDDYGCTTCPGATKAIDEFLADKKEKMLSFASGGGFLVKGHPTAKMETG